MSSVKIRSASSGLSCGRVCVRGGGRDVRGGEILSDGGELIAAPRAQNDVIFFTMYFYVITVCIGNLPVLVVMLFEFTNVLPWLP